jgi:cytidylate kinase
MTNKTIITIDGPSASGKGTLARGLGHLFDMAVLDTGLLYRLVGLACHRQGVDPHDDARAAAIAQDLVRDLTMATLLAAPDLRGIEAGRYASVYGALLNTRAALTSFQRDFADHPPLFPHGRHPAGAILDGRDCGTVIYPLAPLKFYVTAEVSERAHRRTLELQRHGIDADYGLILNELMVRDHRDATRAVAPTKPAEDAVMIDTTDRRPEDVIDEVADIVTDRLRIARTVLSAEIKKNPEELV